MSILRRNPAIFNKTNRANFIASDYKCHLFAATFGFIVGGLFMGNHSIWSLQFVKNMLPFMCLLISDGYYGQYMVQQRIKRNLAKRKERERQRRINEQNQTIIS